MISSIRGEVLSAGTGWVVIAVGGMGFRVEVPTRTPNAHLDAYLELHTQLVVREDSLTLFGFATSEELEVFGILLGVSGVGPRSALGVLSELTPAQVAQAAASEDEKPFRKVSGIGPKTAKLIVVHLTGKLAAPAVQTAPASVAGAVQAQVTQALVGLGWNERTAAEALDAILSDADASERGSVTALLRLALARLGPARPAEAARG